jgi:predicted nucleic acid-binding protein
VIFVDTGAWFAITVPWDINHLAGSRWFERNTQPLITTDYVIDETLTLFRSRGEPERALILGERLFSARLTSIYYLTQEDVEESWRTFRRFSDKEWSFTDCTSKVVMEKLGITHAFAFDQDFRQFGTVTVVP